MKLALSIIAAATLISCNRHSMPQQVPVKTTETIRERLVPVPVPSDSSLLTALFACDSLNNVYLKSISEQKGANLQSSVSFDGGELKYKTVYLHDTLYVPVTDTITITEVPITIEVPVETNRLLWWQKCLIWCGVASILYAGYKVYNVFNFFK